jgi:hypothetical protein
MNVVGFMLHALAQEGHWVSWKSVHLPDLSIQSLALVIW